MITKDYLDEYDTNIKNYMYEIKRITRDINIENRKMTADSVAGSSKTFPYTKKHYKVTGINLNKINKLEKRRKYFEKKKRKLEEELEYKLKKLSEEDAIIADIIRQKYIYKKEWKQIAVNCSYSGESGPRNYFNRYFNKK